MKKTSIFHQKSSENLKKNLTKLRLLRKSTKTGAWGRHFRRKTGFLDDLGDPGEALGEVLGRILERNFFAEKKKSKKGGEGGCLGGGRGPRQGGIIGRIRPGLARLSPIWMGGRIVCASRHPPRPL